MMGAAESPRVGADCFFHGDKSADPGGSQFFSEDLLRLPDAAQIQFRSSARAP